MLESANLLPIKNPAPKTTCQSHIPRQHGLSARPAGLGVVEVDPKERLLDGFVGGKAYREREGYFPLAAQFIEDLSEVFVYY